jgi:energy-coupling factor transporter ATP-binding protein EcfA2
MRRLKLPFAGLEVEFADRERGIQQVQEWSEKGTWHPVVVFGPEGCGKTAWLRQAAELLREEGYEVFYLHPLDKLVYAEVSVPSVREAFAELARRAFAEEAPGRIAWAVFDFVRELLKTRKSKVAVVADDVFQAIGLDKAAGYVKGLLNMIEHPLYSYERMVVIVATSEGVSRGEIGRHRWADLMPIWNMGREGFEQLYRQIPEPKPDVEEAWRITGGNPGILADLYRAKWDVGAVVGGLARRKRLSAFLLSLSSEERGWLRQAVEDPDTLFARERLPLMEKLAELNLIVESIEGRESWYWVDQPPPERDPEIGVGWHAAWQSPLHREAVRRALAELGG